MQNAQISSYPKFQIVLFKTAIHRYPGFGFGAGWFEIGHFGRKERAISMAFQVKKTKELYQSMPKSFLNI